MNTRVEKIKVKIGEKIGDERVEVDLNLEDKRVNDKFDPENIITDKLVTKAERNNLIEILRNFSDCVAADIFELGCTDKIKMNIELKPGTVPKTAKPYRASLKERETTKELVQKWKEAGIVCDTQSQHLFVIRALLDFDSNLSIH